MRHVMTICAALLLCGGFARAQGGAPEEEMKKRMEEIARLMRDSERLLLEITQVDRLIEQQEEIVRKLEALEPPPTEAQAEELRRKQEEVARKIQELFQGQKQTAELTVKQLEDLLKSLPRGQGHGQGPPKDQDKRPQPDEEKRLKDREEKKQQQENRGPRDKKDLFKDRPQDGKRPKDDVESARMRRIQAWIARLPPEEQERLSRNDFSGIPARYRRLIREYTALRAKREAEEDPGKR